MHDGMRRLLIDRLLTERKIVTFNELMSVLQASAPTVKRDLRFMREVLGAPIIYSRAAGGYSYDPAGRTRKTHTSTVGVSAGRGAFRKTWYSPQELYILVKTADLLAELSKDESSALYKDLEPLRSRVISLLTLGGKLPMDLLPHIKIVDEFSDGLNGEPESFATVGAALSAKCRLQIHYEKPKSQASVREISPLRLVHYRNRWYVDAFCHTAEEFRTFAIENIKHAELLMTPAKICSAREISANLDSSYGLFRGFDVKQAVIRFDEEAAVYIRRQTWHPKQRLAHEAGGGCRLTLPYADPTELVGEIMRWGSHAQVVEPAELRETVRERLQETLNQYQSKE